MDLQTLLQAFKLMGSNVEGIFKLIGYEIALNLFGLILGLIMVFFEPLMILIVPFAVFSIIYKAQSYRLIFTEKSTTVSEAFEVSFTSFEKHGWRLFGFNVLAILLVVGLLVFFFGINPNSLGVDSGVMEIGSMNHNHILDLVGFATPALLTLVGVFLLISFGVYTNYVDTFISLGQPKATRKAFAQWKSVLLCAGISVGILVLLLFIPILGVIVSTIFNFVLPLKIVLDVKQMITVSEGSSYAETGCQN